MIKIDLLTFLNLFGGRKTIEIGQKLPQPEDVCHTLGLHDLLSLRGFEKISNFELFLLKG